jgi:hypothetical protein
MLQVRETRQGNMAICPGMAGRWTRKGPRRGSPGKVFLQVKAATGLAALLPAKAGRVETGLRPGGHPWSRGRVRRAREQVLPGNRAKERAPPANLVDQEGATNFL